MLESSSQEVTHLLLAWRQGEKKALDKLICVVYRELRRLAHHYMSGERSDHTLQTTALINEAYLRLLDCRKVNWQDRIHFFAVAAQMMRRVLVDYARSHQQLKRGRGLEKISFSENRIVSNDKDPDLVVLDDALKTLAKVDSRKSQVVELRFFGGLSVEETAEALGVSPDTVMRDWRLAKAWLAREMSRPITD